MRRKKSFWFSIKCTHSTHAERWPCECFFILLYLPSTLIDETTCVCHIYWVFCVWDIYLAIKTRVRYLRMCTWSGGRELRWRKMILFVSSYFFLFSFIHTIITLSISGSFRILHILLEMLHMEFQFSHLSVCQQPYKTLERKVRKNK